VYLREEAGRLTKGRGNGLDLPAAGGTTTSLPSPQPAGVWRRRPLPTPIAACQTGGHTVCDAAITPA